MHYVGSSVLAYEWKEISSKDNLISHVMTKLRHIYCFLGGGAYDTFDCKDTQPSNLHKKR